MVAWRWVPALLFVLAGASVVPAADPDVSSSAQGPGSSGPGWAPPALGALPPAPLSGDSTPDLVAGELMLGLPVAARLQAVLPHQSNVAFGLEGIAGLYVIVPFAGAGGRAFWTVSQKGNRAFQINPGVEVDYVPPVFSDTQGVVVTPTVQFLWLHDLDLEAQSEMGFELGGGYWFEEKAFVPRLSFLMGIRF
ncbi:MAG: hypothetical protein JO112_23775 [Planctomycetes bacterium]|nr:hypothetical protein [Planctomycetota bacterium]